MPFSWALLSTFVVVVVCRSRITQIYLCDSTSCDIKQMLELKTFVQLSCDVCEVIMINRHLIPTHIDAY